VNSVSLVFQRALKMPGMTPQTAPAMTDTGDEHDEEQKREGMVAPNLIMQNAVTMPPTRIWPSAPMFQNRILKAGARPTAMQSSIMVSRMVAQNRLAVLKAAVNTWWHRLSEGSFLRWRKSPDRRRPRPEGKERMRIPHAFQVEIPVRLEM
jgi:hypothetical protein